MDAHSNQPARDTDPARDADETRATPPATGVSHDDETRPAGVSLLTGSDAAAAGAGRADPEGPGAIIGRYTLIRPIGQGGFGTVFLAEQREPVARTVALKIIKLGMDTRQVIARFEQERQALALMDHPHIAKVLDAGATENGRPYFVMEYCDGEAITAYCDKQQLAIRERLALFVQVCQAVQHAHQKGLIHRDIKPSNVLVHTQDGRPHAKVIDFGIAKATASKLTDKTLFTEHAQFIGTPQYMSPEQAAGSPDIDTRTDVYALGVLLYELLTGVTPFDPRALRSAAYHEIQRIIREVEPPSPSTRLGQDTRTLPGVAAQRRTEPRRLGSTIRGELDWITMKALEKERQRRYATANGLAGDIQRFLEGAPVLAAPPSAAYRLRKFIRRNRGPVAAGVLVALALVGGAGLAVAGLIQASQQRDRALAAEARAVADAERATQAEARAVAEAATANQIADFLAAMLQGVGPQVALGRDTTLLREIVDQTARRVERELAEQPAVAGRLLRIIAAVYNSLAAYDQAEPLARKSVELARALPGENRIPVGRALLDVAQVLESTGRYDEALATFQESYDLYCAAGAGETEDALTALSGVGGVHYRVNRNAAAESVFRQVLDGWRKAGGGGDSSRLATSLERLALTLSQRPDGLAEAEELDREALAMRRRLFGDVHPDVALGLSNMATLLTQQGRLDEALAMGAESVALHERIYGPRHPHTAAAIGALASSYERAQRYADAIPLAQRALDINRATLGPEHRTTLNTNFQLGTLLEAAQDYAGAEEQYRALLAYGRSHYESGDNRTSAVIMLVARTVSRQGRAAAAEALYREALEAGLQKRPAGHPQIAEARQALADCLVAQQRFAEAEPLLLAAEEDARLPEAPSDRKLAARRALADFYTQWHAAAPGEGHDAQAAAWQRQGS